VPLPSTTAAMTDLCLGARLPATSASPLVRFHTSFFTVPLTDLVQDHLYTSIMDPPDSTVPRMAMTRTAFPCTQRRMQLGKFSSSMRVANGSATLATVRALVSM
jgi:hypothetical protein